MFRPSFHDATAIAVALLLAGPAWAGASDDPPPAAAEAAASFGTPVTAGQLDGARGGSGGIASDTALTGTVSNNSAHQVVTGANTISESSFAGATGIPIVIQNTGANVLIQNATVINLQFAQ